MKVTMNVECTPEEARQFLGLPDIAPLQEQMMADLQQRMTESMRNLDPETFMKTWMPLTMQSWAEMQKNFLAQMNNYASNKENK
jgi:hypothetical protein